MEQMITNLGFPIACTMATGGAMFMVVKYFMEKDKASSEDTHKIIENMREDAKEDRAMYKDTIDNFSDKLDMFGMALENNNSELGTIKHDIEKIKEKVGV